MCQALETVGLSESSSSSFRKKSFSDDLSVMEDFLLHMKMIGERERVSTPPGEVMMRSWLSS